MNRLALCCLLFAAAVSAQEEGMPVEGGEDGEVSRREEWRRHPLDLNTATVEELRQLPGVERPLAGRIVAARKKQGGFRGVNELGKIPGVNDEIVQALAPFVTCRKSSRFSGDVRVRLRRLHPLGDTYARAPARLRHREYLYNRTRLRYGRQLMAGGMARRPSPGPPLGWRALRREGTMKSALQWNARDHALNVVLGNYALGYGQGLVFYDGLGEYVRPAKIKALGGTPDFSGGSNDYLQGALCEKSWGAWRASLFVSRKGLDLRKSTSTNTVSDSLEGLRERMGDPLSENDLANRDTAAEYLWGGRLLRSAGDHAALGATVYSSRYSLAIDPPPGDYAAARLFNGDGARGCAADFDLFLYDLNLFGEAAASFVRGPRGRRSNGKAWTLTPLIRRERAALWLSLYDYNAAYFARHGKGVTLEVSGGPESRTANQRGAVAGFEYAGRRQKHRLNAGLARYPLSRGDGENARPLFPSEERRVFWESVLTLSREWELTVRGQRVNDERRAESGAQTPVKTDRCRLQAAWEPVRSLRLIGRYKARKERAAGGDPAYGDGVMADARWKSAEKLTVNVRVYLFDSPRAFLTSGNEEVWSGVSHYQLAGGMGNFRGASGARRYLMVRCEVTPLFSLWVKLDENVRDDGTGLKRGVHVQTDYRWGMGVS